METNDLIFLIAWMAFSLGILWLVTRPQPTRERPSWPALWTQETTTEYRPKDTNDAQGTRSE